MSTPTSRCYARSIRAVLSKCAEATVDYRRCAPMQAFVALFATATRGSGMMVSSGLVGKMIQESGL